VKYLVFASMLLTGCVDRIECIHSHQEVIGSNPNYWKWVIVCDTCKKDGKEFGCRIIQ
jgi:hypothetical protein